MASLVCNACQVVIKSTDERASHYKTDWHRYNVKRRCAGLIPVERETFKEKVSVLLKEKTEGNLAQKCDNCNKTFKNDKAREQHYLSKIHKKQVAKLERKKQKDAEQATPEAAAEAENKVEMNVEVDANGEQKTEEQLEVERANKEMLSRKPIPLKHCLFCTRSFQTIDKCLEHMLKDHGFFIPYIEYLKDLEGLLEYLGAKIGIGHVCLWCNGKGKAAYKSAYAVQQHMRAKSHCKLNIDNDTNDEEYLPFFTFGDEDDEDMAVDAEEKGGELVEVNSKSGTLVEVKKPKRQLEGMNDEGELIMSDGSVIGHRSLNKYYRQNLRPEPTEEEMSIIGKMRQRYITLPGYEDKVTLQNTNKIRQRASKAYMKLGMKGNSILQKHFVDRNVF